MEAKYNLWLEKDGNVVMSLWRANFLKAIAAERSLKMAAEKMHISYHEAQMKLDEMEAGLGFKVATYIPCEEGQEEIRLTPEGERLLQNFEEFSSGFDREVTDKFKEKFTDGSISAGASRM
jgi:molybdate transport repressor ModE-like protein